MAKVRQIASTGMRPQVTTSPLHSVGSGIPVSWCWRDGVLTSGGQQNGTSVSIGIPTTQALKFESNA